MDTFFAIFTPKNIFNIFNILFSIFIFRPDVIEYDKLVKEEPIKNLNVAFDAAERELGILPLLDAPGKKSYG